MKSSKFLGLILVCALVGPLGAAETSKHAASPHSKSAISCFDCHQEETPTKAPADSQTCMDCHGDAPAVADLTKQLPVNPHNPPAAKHTKTYDCIDCHYQHKPPVVKCLECHATYKLTAK